MKASHPFQSWGYNNSISNKFSLRIRVVVAGLFICQTANRLWLLYSWCYSCWKWKWKPVEATTQKLPPSAPYSYANRKARTFVLRWDVIVFYSYFFAALASEFYNVIDIIQFEYQHTYIYDIKSILCCGKTNYNINKSRSPVLVF